MSAAKRSTLIAFWVGDDSISETPVRLRVHPLMATVEVRKNGTYTASVPSIDLEGKGTSQVQALDNLVARMASYALNFCGLEPPTKEIGNVAFQRWLNFKELVDISLVVDEVEQATKQGEHEDSQKTSGVAKRFDKLFNVWNSECAFLSSTTARLNHVVIQQIMDLGTEVVPFVVDQGLSDAPDVFIIVLKRLTNADPADGLTKTTDIVNAWRDWAKNNILLDP